MDAGEVRFSTNVILRRNAFGQFTRKLENAAHDAVEEAVERGARMSRQLAPTGGKSRASYAKRPGYVPLKRSIRTHVSGNRGYWYSVAPHARFVEEGTRPHRIEGELVFYWPPSPGNPKGWFVWSKEGFDNYTPRGAYVNHPGTEAQPFLRPAYERVVKRQMSEILREKFSR